TTAKKETTSSTEKTTEQKTQTSTNKPTQTTTKAPGRATIKTIKKGKRKAQLKWKKVSKAKGYMIQYSTSKKFKRSQTKTKYATKMNLMVKKLKSKKTYYFRMKAYTK
ncbi:fibronectin type III domain-containing protein, partial [Klebsiella pneumoniae]|nr:fibronectin type III domain-containing protein [Klebsiella pneumoniae]